MITDSIGAPRAARGARVYLAHAPAGLLLCLSLACLASCVELESDEGLVALSPEAVSLHVPVIELTVEPAAFDSMTRYPRARIKIPARFALTRRGRPAVAERAARLQVKGNSSSALSQKSLGVKFADAVHNEAGALLDAPHVDVRHDLDRLKAIRLRNGGNEFASTLIKDLGFARMVASAGLHVVPVYGEPAAVYVNGAFYGLANLRSETNGDGLSRLLAIEEDDLAIAEVSNYRDFDVLDGEGERFIRLSAAAWAHDIEHLRREVDSASLIDHVIVGAALAVWDWPWNNVRVYADGEASPLRFVSFDFDQASEIHLDEGLLWHLRNGGRGMVVAQIFEVFYAEPAFRERFWSRYDEVLAGGRLHPRRLRAELAELAAVYEPIIGLQTARHGVPSSRAAWYIDLERAIEGYEERYRRLQRDDGRRADGM